MQRGGCGHDMPWYRRVLHALRDHWWLLALDVTLVLLGMILGLLLCGYLLHGRRFVLHICIGMMYVCV
jgi:hypothetical protein